MADFSEINQEINEQINTNGQRAITGAKLNEVLRDMISSVDENKMDVVEIDTVPTEGSTNLVKSGGVYDALQGKVNVISVFGIQNLTEEQVRSLRVGDVVINKRDRTHDVAYYVFTQIERSNSVDLVNVSDNIITICRYAYGVYQETVAIDIAQKASEFTNGNVVSFDENGNLADSGIASSDVATQSDLTGKQDTIDDLATIRSGAALGATALQAETDPTVPSWAKQSTKPSYDYSEIGNTPDLSGFITNTVNNLTNYYLKSETYTKDEVAALIAAIQQFHYEIYATLPQTGQGNVLYLIGPTGSGSDKYEEYVYANNTWNKIGDTSIDLSGYVTTSALNTALADYTTTSNLTILLAGKADKVTTPSVLTVTEITQLTYTQVEALRQGDIVSASDLAYYVNFKTGSDCYLSSYDGNDLFFCLYYKEDNTWVNDGVSSVNLYSKADKVQFATPNNFAALNAEGNIVDSGSKATDFATAAQGAKADTAYQKPSTGIPASDLASGVIPQSEVFVAEYGVTTTVEIENAILSGKVIICVYNYRLYVYGTYSSNSILLITKHFFYCWVGNKCYQISLRLDTNAWNDEGYVEIPDISNYVQKSQTSGLLKNDGTVDTTQYGTYSKPSGGIPASDIASGVIPSVPVQDVTVGGTSVVSGGTAAIPAIPTVPTISTDVATDKADNTKTTGAKAVYDAINPAYGSSQPQGGMSPNVLYKLGTLSGSVTITFATPTDNTIENEYKFTFTADSTAPTIAWPQSVTSWIGNSLDNGAPKVEADTYYEVSVLDGCGIFNKF